MANSDKSKGKNGNGGSESDPRQGKANATTKAKNNSMDITIEADDIKFDLRWCHICSLHHLGSDQICDRCQERIARDNEGEDYRFWTVICEPLTDDLGLEIGQWFSYRVDSFSKDEAAAEAVEKFDNKIVVVGVI